MGTTLAWVIVRYRFPGRRVLSTVVDLPLAIPTLVWGVMILVLYGPNSVIGGRSPTIGIHVLFTPIAIVLALCTVTLPFVVRNVQPVLLELDEAEEEAAATLGASRGRDVPPGGVPGDPLGDRRGHAPDVLAVPG